MALKRSRKVAAKPRRARHARRMPHAGVFGADYTDAHAVRLDSPYRLGARMRSALFVSLLLHLLVIFGIGVPIPQMKLPERQVQSLEVVLVNAKTPTKPVKAEALAQHNLDGGGNVDDDRRAQTPLPALPKQKTDADVQLALRRVEQLEREARQVMTQPKSKAAVQTAPPAKSRPQPDPAPAKPAPQAPPTPAPEQPKELTASDLMQRSLELARLEAKISREWDEYQKRPRRRFIGSRTQETRFARYIEDWRQKVERVGDLNYPQGARDQRIHGRLVVTVAIKADGSVEQVDINRPSGHKILDDAARKIVALAAPFAPFPPDIAKDVDILHITRTWTFTTADRFVSE